METIGLLGVGLMGSAITRRLKGAGLGVLAWDVDARARERLEALGGKAAGSIAQIAREAKIVVSAVFDTDQLEDVTMGPAGLASVPAGERRAKIVVNTSTCDPDRVAALAQRMRGAGLALVELPVSGSSGQVADGDAVGLVAGEAGDIEAADAVIRAICPRTYNMGAVGNGLRTKLAINHILGLNRAALAEGLVLAERLGLPLQAFLDAAKGSAAYSQVMDIKGAKMVGREFSAQGKVGQSLKDFKLIVAQARARGQELPLADVYVALMSSCVAAGESDLDNAAVIAEIARRGRK